MTKVLLLNSDGRPLNICTWKRALLLLIKGKARYAQAIQNIEDFITVDKTLIPKVIKLTYNLAVPNTELPFCRENILIRDNYTCQYCGVKLTATELTLDHVYPKSRLGPEIWENMVACCKDCNQRKANRTPREAGMKLLRRPYRPVDYFDFERKKYSSLSEKYWDKYFKAS